MNNDQHAKSQKTLADNQRWLDDHPKQVFHTGDLPIAEHKSEPEKNRYLQQ